MIDLTVPVTNITSKQDDGWNIFAEVGEASESCLKNARAVTIAEDRCVANGYDHDCYNVFIGREFSSIPQAFMK